MSMCVLVCIGQVASVESYLDRARVAIQHCKGMFQVIDSPVNHIKLHKVTEEIYKDFGSIKLLQSTS